MWIIFNGMVARHRIDSNESVCRTIRRSNGNRSWRKRICENGRNVSETDNSYFHRLRTCDIIDKCKLTPITALISSNLIFFFSFDDCLSGTAVICWQWVGPIPKNCYASKTMVLSSFTTCSDSISTLLAWAKRPKIPKSSMRESFHPDRVRALLSWQPIFVYFWSIASKIQRFANCRKCQVSRTVQHETEPGHVWPISISIQQNPYWIQRVGRSSPKSVTHALWLPANMNYSSWDKATVSVPYKMWHSKRNSRA